MILEILLILYSLGIITFLWLLFKDKYVEINRAVILVYTLASIFWPLTWLFYLIDTKQ